jgi:hypothetical protein
VRSAPPSPTSCLPVTWTQESTAATADRHARAFMAWFFRRRSGRLTTQEHLLLVSVVSVVLAVAVTPAALVGLVAVAWFVGWTTGRRARMLARGLAEGPGAHDPTTVTLDADGVHVVGRTATAHHRWADLGGVALRRGFLVLEDREHRSPVEVLCLDHLAPSVDRDRLVAEVERAIAAGAP